MGIFSGVIILLSVVVISSAQLFGSGQQYVPDYITPLVEQCLLLNLEALISSNSQLTPAQETVICAYYSYCQNIMNMALLVSTVSSQGSSGGGSQSMSSSQFSMQQQAQAQSSSQSFNMQQQSSVSQNQNAQMTDPMINSADPTLSSTNMG